jgi:hypothetical protein
VILGRKPQGEEFQDAKGFAEDGRVAQRLAVRHERLRLGGALRVYASSSASLHRVRQNYVLNSLMILSTNYLTVGEKSTGISLFFGGTRAERL